MQIRSPPSFVKCKASAEFSRINTVRGRRRIFSIKLTRKKKIRVTVLLYRNISNCKNLKKITAIILKFRDNILPTAAVIACSHKHKMNRGKGQTSDWVHTVSSVAYRTMSALFHVTVFMGITVIQPTHCPRANKMLYRPFVIFSHRYRKHA